MLKAAELKNNRSSRTRDKVDHYCMHDISSKHKAVFHLTLVWEIASKQLSEEKEGVEL